MSPQQPVLLCCDGSDGLLWGPGDGRICVSVADTKTGDNYAFDVPEPDRAMHAFRHPRRWNTTRSPPTTSPDGS